MEDLQRIEENEYQLGEGEQHQDFLPLLLNILAILIQNCGII